MNEFETKALKAKKAKEFLDFHPALSASPFGEMSREMVWGIEPVCRRGEWESSKGYMSVRRGDKSRGWERFKDEFDKEEKELYDTYDSKTEKGKKDIEIQKRFLHLNKTYEEIYGEKWKFDHVIYWYEMSFSVFKGKIGSKDWMDFKCWDRYDGLHGEKGSFEDMLIDMASRARKIYGNFKIYDKALLSEKEIENHKKEECFFFVPCKKHKGYTEMKDNKKYFDVHNDLYNLRWLRWFIDTEYCKKNWKNEFEWVRKKNLYPNG